jgi:hypothetical protein
MPMRRGPLGEAVLSAKAGQGVVQSMVSRSPRSA